MKERSPKQLREHIKYLKKKQSQGKRLRPEEEQCLNEWGNRQSPTEKKRPWSETYLKGNENLKMPRRDAKDLEASAAAVLGTSTPEPEIRTATFPDGELPPLPNVTIPPMPTTETPKNPSTGEKSVSGDSGATKPPPPTGIPGADTPRAEADMLAAMWCEMLDKANEDAKREGLTHIPEALMGGFIRPATLITFRQYMPHVDPALAAPIVMGVGSAFVFYQGSKAAKAKKARENGWNPNAPNTNETPVDAVSTASSPGHVAGDAAATADAPRKNASEPTSPSVGRSQPTNSQAIAVLSDTDIWKEARGSFKGGF